MSIYIIRLYIKSTPMSYRHTETSNCNNRKNVSIDWADRKLYKWTQLAINK